MRRYTCCLVVASCAAAGVVGWIAGYAVSHLDSLLGRTTMAVAADLNPLVGLGPVVAEHVVPGAAPQSSASTVPELTADALPEALRGLLQPPSLLTPAELAAAPALADAGTVAGDFWTDLFGAPKSTPGGSEESEDLTGPPRCEEDPAYDDQYPGCPYTGPRSRRGQDQPPTEDVTPPAEKKKPEQGTSTAMKRPTDLIELPGGTEECPAHPEVDTMEFRPSDAHGKAFDALHRRVQY